jgi:hypothetical protein
MKHQYIQLPRPGIDVADDGRELLKLTNNGGIVLAGNRGLAYCAVSAADPVRWVSIAGGPSCALSLTTRSLAVATSVRIAFVIAEETKLAIEKRNDDDSQADGDYPIGTDSGTRLVAAGLEAGRGHGSELRG